MNERNKTITKKQYLDALIINKGNNERTRKQLGLSYNIYYRWRQTDPEFDTKVKEAMNAMTEFVEDKFTEKLEEGNLPAITFYLKTHGWSEKKEIKVSSDNTVNINEAIDSIKTELKDDNE